MLILNYIEIFIFKEWYDFDNKLARIDYQPLGSQGDILTGKHKM